MLSVKTLQPEEVPEIEPMMQRGKSSVVLMSPSYDPGIKSTAIESGDEEEEGEELSARRPKPGWKDDLCSILLLLYLYLLQGVPIGLIAAIPLILQSKGVTLSEQAVFSFANWPFSLKLLWAPIVDAVYWKRLGRRKSWTVPVQYLIGIFLLVISYFSSEILGSVGEKDSKLPNVTLLMSMFLALNFLAATQDIAVDGWALTMLSRKNVGYASTCNVVGQVMGYFLGHVVFLTLQSKDFANKWFRSTPGERGIVEFNWFVFFWGWVFIVSTTLVWAFKEEVDNLMSSSKRDEDDLGQSAVDEQAEEEEMILGILDTYKVLAKIICLKPMILMAITLLTAKIAFAATDAITDLKFIAAGITTDKIASRLIFLTPLQIILPWILSKQTAGPRPLSVYLWAYPYRILMGLALAAMVYWTPSFRENDGEFSYLYYVIWIVVYHFHQVAFYCIFLSTMGFFAQISDPLVGGTYMTFLNTLNNLGGNWPMTLFLKLTDLFNRKNCLAKETRLSKTDEELCKASGDVCELVIDGYYVSVFVCTVIGLLWFRFFYRRIQYFQRLPRISWKIAKRK